MDRIQYDPRTTRERLKTALKSGTAKEIKEFRDELIYFNDEYQIDLFFTASEKAEIRKVG